MGSLTQKNRQTPPRAMASDRSLSSALPSSRAPHESPCLATAGAGCSCTTTSWSCTLVRGWVRARVHLGDHSRATRLAVVIVTELYLPSCCARQSHQLTYPALPASISTYLLTMYVILLVVLAVR